MENKRLLGHIAAIFTIIVWGTTFISTKVLLTDFNPVEILFIRLLLGLVALFIVYPKPMRGLSVKNAAEIKIFLQECNVFKRRWAI